MDDINQKLVELMELTVELVSSVQADITEGDRRVSDGTKVLTEEFQLRYDELTDILEDDDRQSLGLGSKKVH